MLNLKNTNIPEIFQAQVATYGDRACVSFINPDTKEYEDISWNEMNSRVQKLAWYLLSIGIRKKDKVALFSPNRPEWWIADIAISSVGAINVPIYATNSSEESRYIIENSESIVCFVNGEDHLERILAVKKKLPNLTKIISFDNVETKKKDVLTLEKAMELGDKYSKKADLQKRINSIKSDDLATIIYTSGTTGDPKGVMLTHDNFVSDARQIQTDFHEYIDDKQVLLSFLPLSHSLERTAGYYLPLIAGCKVAFAEDFSKVVDNMQMVKPTFIVSVPRLYEKIHSTILSKLPEASIVKRVMFALAIKTASKNLKYVCTDTTPKGLLALRVKLFDKLVFSKLKEGLGMDQMQFAVSGGAPLSITDAEFFIGMGIKILEGFGLTETTPVTNVNPPWFIKPGTVGPPLPETKVRISDEGELQIKGPQVMKGYFKNKKATDEVFTKDGWFKTGDIARIDEDNYVAITGRIKDIIVTAGGKNISPQNIESSLKASKFIEQVAIIGDKRKYLSALVIPAFETLQNWAKANSISFTDNSDLVKNTMVIEMLGEEIKQHTTQFARVEQIRRFTLFDAEWTQETGEITPSLKVKRRVLEDKYSKEIEAMYKE